MAELRADGQPVDAGGFRFRASGLNGTVEATIDQPVVRERGADPLASPLRELLLHRFESTPGDAFEVAPIAAKVEIQDVEATRGGPEGATLGAEVDTPAGRIPILLAENEDGLLSWELPVNHEELIDAGTAIARDGVTRDAPPQVLRAQFAISIDEPEPGDEQARGAIGFIAKKVFRVVSAALFDRLLEEGGEQLTKWMERNRPHRLRYFGPDDYTSEQAQAIDAAELANIAAAGGRALLFIHGTNSRSHEGFGEIPQAYMRELWDRYRGRVLAFDHPTLSKSPSDNATWLADLLPGGLGLRVDVISHSRGGLVARELAERGDRLRLGGRLDVQSVAFVGTPNRGTPLCQPQHLARYVDTLTNFLSVLPDNGVTDAIDAIVGSLSHIARKAYEGIPGAMVMDPNGEYLKELNKSAAGARYFGMSVDFEPTEKAGWKRRLRDLVFDTVFDRAANDLVVPTESVWDGERVTDGVRLDRASGLDHSTYWRADAALTELAQWFGTETTEPAAQQPVTVAVAATSAAAEPSAAREGETPKPRVRVSALNASLEHSRFPVAVGHYAGLPQGGAESFLDVKLGGSLSRRLRLGLYPQDEGTAHCVRAPQGRWPRGAVVLGLGNFGALSRGSLSASMCKGVLAVALNEFEQGIDHAEDPLGISAVVVGAPGRFGPSLEGAVTALTEGAIRAILKLREDTASMVVDEFELEFVELYEQRAEQIAEVVGRLEELLNPRLFEAVDLTVVRGLARRAGARPGASSVPDPSEPWVRVQVELDTPEPAAASTGSENKEPFGLAKLEFTTLARGAQANRIEHEVDLDKLYDFVDSVIHQAEAGSAISRTLFELLFPHRAKLDLDPSENLHLLLDERVAHIPWELLSARSNEGDTTALSLRAGMLRQLHSREQTRERWERPIGLQALVIGDPPTHLARLRGARREAEKVRELLGLHNWTVTDRIYDGSTKPERTWIEMLNALHAQPYRAVHIAAHGIFDAADPERSGVVIGPAPHHRLTALDFRQMTVAPDLVFLNCCHLGRLDGRIEGATEAETWALNQPHRVAATVARQLLLNGVSAVIVAGWAVGDTAAAAFSETLYEAMLNGRSFGDAVKSARGEAREADGGRSNTWGAYQCWGDPDFRLVSDEAASGRRYKPVSARQFARDLEVLAIRAGDAQSLDHQGRLAAELAEMLDVGEEYGKDSGVLAALARVNAELGRYQHAIDAYARALGHPKSYASVIDAEQLANVCVRRAVQIFRNAELTEQEREKRIDELLHQAEQVLDGTGALARDANELVADAPKGQPDTPERDAMRGSLYKKKAALRRAGWEADLVKARDFYQRALKSTAANNQKQEAYHANAWLQLSFLSSNGDPDPALVGHLEDLLDQVWMPAIAPNDYWGAAQLADALVTCAIAGYAVDHERSGIAKQDLLAFLKDTMREGSAEASTCWLDVAIDRYLTAFALHSTLREKNSSIDHLDDLSRLAPSDSILERDLKQAYERLVAELQT